VEENRGTALPLLHTCTSQSPLLTVTGCFSMQLTAW
jgi:hypothetical protein